ncbi:MAG: cytochrome P460 family protein [Trichormus sp. ATA11-4-KO1]|jgi:hypothetical protein|nr:cytochrome P460 family protein [Trichormus sp. ATA11-4-KO1]
MKQHKWFLLLILFISSIAVAIVLAHLISFFPYRLSGNGYTQGNFAVAITSPVQFPVNYQQKFMHYATVDCPNSRIVRQMYVNHDSLDVVATSEVVPSNTVIVMETYSANQSDQGNLTPTQLNNIFIREKRNGWNIDPHSGEWQSAWYSPSGSLVSDNQGSCIGCHTKVRERDYVFTLPALIAAAKTRQLQYQPTEFGSSVCQ